jgi:hypothetical protein
VSRTLFLVLALASTEALADGLSAPASAVADGGLRPSVGQLNLTGGTGGVAALAGFGAGFAFTSYDYSGRDLEVGGGLRFQPVGPLRVWLSGSALVAPVGGEAGGGRLAAGVAARFGQRWFIRPGLGISLGVVGSPEGRTFLLPIEGSLEAGYTWDFVSVYLRGALGLDPLSGPLVTARGAVSLGLSIPLGTVPQRGTGAGSAR